MPNCFTLTKKGGQKPSKFDIIDAELCEMLGIAVDPDRYVSSWYGSIGFSLASGKDWEWCMNRFGHDETDAKIIRYLKDNYEVNAWYES